MTTDRAFSDWVAAGKAVKLIDVLDRRGHSKLLKKSGHELVGPCPHCGGTDRFAVKPNENVWHCRGCSRGGGAIQLVENIDGCDFLQAVETLTGDPAPGRTSGESAADRQAREDRWRAMAVAAAEAEKVREAKRLEWREREIGRASEIWKRGRSPVASPVEAYLALRRVTLPQEARIRFADAQPLWDGPPPSGRMVHRGPAMLAKIEDGAGTFIGVHITWIDLGQPKGKVMVPDSETGEFVPAKKVRGSQRGGTIGLAKPLDGRPARALVIGEGIETVLSVRDALMASGESLPQIAEFRSAVSLGNLSGSAGYSVRHPTLMRADKLGRMRRVRVPGPTPKFDKHDTIALGPCIEFVILLGDGDSEPFETDLALQRAAARLHAAYPDVMVRRSMAADGLDFNDEWIAAQGAAPHQGAGSVETLPDEALPCPV